MKLDLDCIRDVLLTLEGENCYYLDEDGAIAYMAVDIETIAEKLPEYDAPQIYYTLKMLDDGGYLQMSERWGDDVLELCEINSLTYDGHQLLEALRPASVWDKLKAALKAAGSFSLPLAEEAGLEILRGLILRD